MEPSQLIIGILGAQVWASQGALSILGIDPVTAAVIATLLFIVYTAASGLWGVTLTDAVQLAIIFVGVPLAAVLGLQEAGGFEGIRETLAATGLDAGSAAGLDSGTVNAANNADTAANTVSGSSPGMDPDAYFHPLGAGGAMVVAAILPAIMYTLIGQDFYQRLFAARDEKIAFRAAALAGVILILYAVFPALAGMAARGIFGADIQPSQAIPMLVAEVLPAWIGAIVVAAIIGAIMSTADSLLVAGTSHLTHDIFGKLMRPDLAGDTRRMLLTPASVRWRSACWPCSWPCTSSRSSSCSCYPTPCTPPGCSCRWCWGSTGRAEPQPGRWLLSWADRWQDLPPPAGGSPWRKCRSFRACRPLYWGRWSRWCCMWRCHW